MLDVLIVGAGPAGLSTAMHLLQLDPSWARRMVLLEKAAHPRPKLCGGGVTRLGLRALQELGFSLPLPIPHVEVEDAHLVYGSRTVHFRGRPQFVVFHRPELDAYLAEQARNQGAVIQENETVREVTTEETGVTVTTNRSIYRSRVVIGADGSGGVVRRAVQPRRASIRVARLLEVVHPAQERAPLFTEKSAHFDFTPVRAGLQGYFWEFPSLVGGQPCFNRGVYDARFAPARRAVNLPQLLARSLTQAGAGPAAEKPLGHPVHWFSPRNLFAAPRLLLVGDAAGADPLFGEGIAPALEYGRVAAQAIQRAFARDDFSFRDYRWQVLNSRVGRYLLFRWCVAWWGYRLSWQSQFMHGVWSLGKITAAISNRKGSE